MRLSPQLRCRCRCAAALPGSAIVKNSAFTVEKSCFWSQAPVIPEEGAQRQAHTPPWEPGQRLATPALQAGLSLAWQRTSSLVKVYERWHITATVPSHSLWYRYKKPTTPPQCSSRDSAAAACGKWEGKSIQGSAGLGRCVRVCACLFPCAARGKPDFQGELIWEKLNVAPLLPTNVGNINQFFFLKGLQNETM